MAFVLKFNVPPSSEAELSTGSCKSFNFYDTSGTSSTGYGSGSNPIVTNVQTATATFTPYGTTDEYEVDVFSGSIPFPNTDNLPFAIYNTQIGVDADNNIPSGLFFVEYVIDRESSVAFNYTAEGYVYIDCAHQCCADQLWARWSAQCATCGSGASEQKALQELQNLAIRVQGTITAIHKALKPGCEEIDQAVRLVEWLNTICSREGLCGCH